MLHLTRIPAPRPQWSNLRSDLPRERLRKAWSPYIQKCAHDVLSLDPLSMVRVCCEEKSISRPKGWAADLSEDTVWCDGRKQPQPRIV